MSENIDKPPVPDEKDNSALKKSENREKRRDCIQIWGTIIQAVLAVTMGIYAFFTFQYVGETRNLRIQNAKIVDQGIEQLRFAKEQYRLTIEPHLTVQVLGFDNQNWEEVKAKISEATKDKIDLTQIMVDEEELNILKGRLTEEQKQLRFYCLVRNLGNQVATKIGVYIYDYKQKNYLACFGRRDPLREKSRMPFSGFTENVRTNVEIEKELERDYGDDAKFAYPYLTEFPTNTYHDESVVFVFYKDLQGRVYCYRQTFGYGRWGIFTNKIVNFGERVDYQK